MSSKPVSLDSLSNDLSKKMFPSVVQAPKLELEKLPKHLKYASFGELDTLLVIISKEELLEHIKYAYLEQLDTLLVIISKDLTSEQEGKLMKVLKEHKLAIG